MRKVFWLIILLLAAVFAVCAALFIPLPEASAHPTWSDYTTETLTTSDTVTTNPIVLIDFQCILDAVVVPRQALEAAREHHISVLENPPSIEAQQMALMRLQRTKAKIDVYDAMLAALLLRQVIVMAEFAYAEFEKFVNPLNPGAWGVE